MAAAKRWKIAGGFTARLPEITAPEVESGSGDTESLCSKVVYAHRRDADVEGQRLGLYAYKCRTCHQYHLTSHEPKELKPRKRGWKGG
jgi:hypothetical protein